MSTVYAQLTEGYSLQCPPSPESSSDSASSPTHSLPYAPSLPPTVSPRYRQYSLPDISQLRFSDGAVASNPYPQHTSRFSSSDRTVEPPVSDGAATSNPYPQHPTFGFSESDGTLVPLDVAESPVDGHASTPRASLHQAIAHPYARLYAKGEAKKRNRKIWSHTLEKTLFNSHELSTMGAPHRRTIYTASLEAHVDRLHAQLLALGLYPIPFSQLEPYRGLNSKTAKVSGWRAR
ncbi:hypothetical protein HWV62_36268 [Athelia sp. TMB]|nr:hypothetical protein HWV62_36268 [Athelia sp. TMB]